ncbi:helix-turn-helix domain-containing protein [Draconibacterium sp. IB214405]|uniref:helix-turn-helix domain-containing protein n=1 Tax=Draconibacterium sp. IB214405 TaxID=3097352 RepID=UPI002A0E56F1|nr:helix-turn-helix domain-containing protein [Draconibacterium sp. IB214405]MDX8339389.1 helix-turn-helix domain-containing protein [Draconibacterium sp. IB214405]
MKNEKNIKSLGQFISTILDELNQPLKDQIQDGFKEVKRQFQPKEPEEYLTRNEVKDLLKVDLSTIHNWTKRGKLKAYGIGNRVYYKRSEVEQAIKPLN